MKNTLLLLPGLACDAELFAHQRPALCAAALGGPVVVSDAHTRAATLPDMARCLLNQHPDGTLTLVGCSMGGMLAFELHRQAPQRISGLALLGTTARSDTPEMTQLRQQACDFFAAGRMSELLAVNVHLAFHPHHAADAGLRKRYLAMMGRAGAQQLIRQNQAVMARPDSRSHLQHIRCPALVVCGLTDRLTPPELAQEMAAALPCAQLALLAEAGHMLTWEQPQLVNDLLLDWLRRLPP
jgi:pimeloyl-ACP methyl ester carboxylesterase